MVSRSALHITEGGGSDHGIWAAVCRNTHDYQAVQARTNLTIRYRTIVLCICINYYGEK